MKHFLFSILFFVLLCNSKAQTDNQIVIGKIDSIQSTILNEKRKIWIYVPDGGPG